MRFKKSARLANKTNSWMEFVQIIYAQIYWVLSSSLKLLFSALFCETPFPPECLSNQIKIVTQHSQSSQDYCCDFLSHPACSSGFIQDFLDHYAALQMQKAVSAFWLARQWAYVGSMMSNVGSMMLHVGWTAPMSHSYRLGLVTWRYQVRVPVGTDICHRHLSFVIDHIQWSKLFKVMECIVLPMVLCTINNPWSHSK